MAHFAQLDENNVVTQVIVIGNEQLKATVVTEVDGFLVAQTVESEAKGVDFCKTLYGADTVWKQTSYNNKFRGNFAGIGMKYYPEHDVFMPPCPYPSWVINSATAKWEAPVAKPDCKRYEWDESTVSWKYIPPRPQPFPSWTLDQCDRWQPPVPRPTTPPSQGNIYK